MKTGKHLEKKQAWSLSWHVKPDNTEFVTHQCLKMQNKMADMMQWSIWIGMDFLFAIHSCWYTRRDFQNSHLQSNMISKILDIDKILLI